MSKKRRLGRPRLAIPLSVRVLARLDVPTGKALARYRRAANLRTDSEAVRVLVVDGLKRAGLLR